MAILGFSLHLPSGFLFWFFSMHTEILFSHSIVSEVFLLICALSSGWYFVFLSPSQCGPLLSFCLCGLCYSEFISVSLIYIIVSNPTSNSRCLWLCWLIRSAFFYSGFYRMESLLNFCAFWMALHSILVLHFWRNRSSLLSLHYSSSLYFYGTLNCPCAAMQSQWATLRLHVSPFAKFLKVTGSKSAIFCLGLVYPGL